MLLDHPSDGPTAIRTQFGAIFVSLELSRSTWVITSLSPGTGEKMSRHSVTAGDTAELMKLFAELRRKAEARTRESYPIITIQEAGLDGFWLHRVLQQNGIESHVVDPASIATSRRRRRAKTDRLDGEALLRALLAYKRGEPRVCAMVVAPSPEEEDRRRLCRERATLIAERITHVNRIKGLLFAQGISDYVPLRRNRRARLEALRTGDGRELPSHLKAQIGRELDRVELLLEQIKAVEAARDALLAAARKPADKNAADKVAPDPVAMLLALKGLGANFAAVLWSEAFYRQFSNRRQVAAYAGLAATPWQSGGIRHEQGVSKAGNPRLRTTMIQLAWLWIRHQPQSALTRWFKERSPQGRKRAIVALARKLLVTLWKYVTAGETIEGAVMKPAA
ncbi:IS110 family transposase [Bradyrhizobium sp. 186]|uniref:IS110 family transposase n=1 Tax=Bradyrhizobium sp. 186 TaxID=2782654 RepID=UPI0020019740|nr:IS110 family transposase [Bradyrhizobium sp. 186]UPK31863.1 IS110 family transposase [Bradyrhizobium sp. 186]UPK32017.1 IS110 family transposase [Bradyrhizobium sp. 186]UPK32929.1 IS110 family transposase [Bradyrhizobium sp. 186]UPK33046.1 IS110 family transposase [Bradyrhizobium sp. 186]UPK33302.1 IS110 family transposase [Bradyrhizobium sp. 186]